MHVFTDFITMRTKYKVFFFSERYSFFIDCLGIIFAYYRIWRERNKDEIKNNQAQRSNVCSCYKNNDGKSVFV